MPNDGSNETFFMVGVGLIPNKQRKKIERVLKKLGDDVDFINPNLPEGPRFWFSGPNLGEPFNSRMERETRAALAAAGLLDADGKLKR